MKRLKTNERRKIGASGAVLVCLGFLAGAAPARAFDDKTSTFEPILGAIGLGGDKGKADIDYRERPRLVVPKSVDLPEPQPSAAKRSANWPKDPDIERRKAQAVSERAPRALEPNKNPALSAREMQDGRSDAAETSPELCPTRTNGTPDCGALTPVDKIKRVFSLGSDDDKDVLKPGVEPSRTYLTEPPKGYRSATVATKATSEGPKERKDYGNAADYIREQAKRAAGKED